MNKCPKCGQTAESRFCPDCGINMQEPTKCPKCHAEIESRFCPDCGYDSHMPSKKGKAKRGFERCKNFVLNHKKQSILTAFLSVFCITVIIVLIATLSNIFRIGKVSKIEIGMTQVEVERILGEPTLDDDGICYWYEDKVAKKIEKAENLLEESFESEDESEIEKAVEEYDKLYAEIESMTYEFIMVNYDSDDKVEEIFFDKKHKYDEYDDYATEKKEVTKAVLNISFLEGYETVTDRVSVFEIASKKDKIPYSVNFEDGSYYLDSVYLGALDTTVSNDVAIITWSDSHELGEYFVQKPIELTGKIVDGDLKFWLSTEEEIILPDTVKSISDNAFRARKTLKKVTLPNTLVSIGDCAFWGCSSLAEINIPDTVTSIGYAAFSNCASLTKVIIPDGVEKIESEVFYNCSNLSSVTIGTNVNSIASAAFKNCQKIYEVVNLSELAIQKGSSDHGEVAKNALIVHKTSNPNSIINIRDDGLCFLEYDDSGILIGYIGNETNLILPDYYNEKSYSIASEAFINNTKIESVTISNGVTSIGEKAFYNCSSLKSITIGDSITSISEYAFGACNVLEEIHISNVASWCNISFTSDSQPLLSNGTKLYLNGAPISELVIPDGVTSIKDYAFSGCDSLTSVKIRNGVTSIGNSAFYDCDSLASVKIGNGVTSIGNSAFHDCDSLASVKIGNGVTSIGNSAFASCDSLSEIYFNATINNLNNRIFSDYSYYYDIGIYESFWGDLEIIIPEIKLTIGKDVKEIPSDLFSSLSITSLEFEEESTCTTIAEEAFFDCMWLKSIEIPSSVVSIGTEAFANCESLNEIYYDANLTENIGLNVFSDSEQGIRLTIGKDVKEIPSLFNFLTITSLEFEEESSCETIGANAFFDCTLLTSVSIPDSVTSIESGAFYSCTSLTSITIPSSVNFIGTEAFANCTLLVEVYNLSSLDVSSYFSNVKIIHTSLNETSILDTVNDCIFMTWEDKYYFLKYIGDKNGFTLPTSYKGNSYEIPSLAFLQDNYALTTLIIPDAEITIAKGAFRGCPFAIFCEATSTPENWSIYWSQYCTVYWYSESKPTTSGNYWIYNNGKIVIWE